ncbi:MAG: hypothetical protein C0592_14380 [Marinilabiliales bacterium]|nr:MAG: hypothetical protein C0592_14380 [Marinilabiliales bacterium]
MKYTFKRPLMLQIIFYLNSAFTLVGLFLLIKRMVIDADAQSAIAMFSSKITPDQIYMAVAVIAIAFLLKWFGAFQMFSRKPWGYILYIIPNIIFLAALIYMIVYGFTRPETFIIAGVTFVMMLLFTIELFCLRGLQRKERASQ